MKRHRGTIIVLILALSLTPVFSQNRRPQVRDDLTLDSIRLSDPAILADKNTSTYYMTGTGGML